MELFKSISQVNNEVTFNLYSEDSLYFYDYTIKDGLLVVNRVEKDSEAVFQNSHFLKVDIRTSHQIGEAIVKYAKSIIGFKDDTIELKNQLTQKDQEIQRLKKTIVSLMDL